MSGRIRSPILQGVRLCAVRKRRTPGRPFEMHETPEHTVNTVRNARNLLPHTPTRGGAVLYGGQAPDESSPRECAELRDALRGREDGPAVRRGAVLAEGCEGFQGVFGGL